VECPICNKGKVVKTTFWNYKRSRTGLECCGKAQVSQKLQNRTFSPESLRKMTAAKRAADQRRGVRSDPEKKEIRSRNAKWRQKVLTLYKYQCVMTGLRLRDPDGADREVECHHLYGQKNYRHLALMTLCGIPLIKSLHEEYHKLYGYKTATLNTFLIYLQRFCNLDTPISRQANLEGFEGSETRVHNPEQIMKLHERLKTLQTLFNRIEQVHYNLGKSKT
jgi:hypothetical protein